MLKHLRKSIPGVVLEGIDTGYFSHCLTGVTMFPENRLDVQHFADIRTLPENIFKDVDAVVHLAAISNDPMGDRYKEVTHDINFQAAWPLRRRHGQQESAVSSSPPAAVSMALPRARRAANRRP